MKAKIYVALAALMVSVGLSTYTAVGQRVPCAGCNGGNSKCCQATNGDIYYRS